MGKTKLNIPMAAALILLMLTMISCHLTSGLYARYTASATAMDSARVARFDVDATVQSVAGKEGEFIVTVTSTSEVTVEYYIEVATSAPLRGTIGDTTLTPTDGKMIFRNDDWVFAPGEGSNSHTLILNVDSWENRPMSEDAQLTEQVNYGFTVNVHAMQVD